MLNISLPDALRIWSELEAALYGTNKYGGTEAEIYSSAVRPLSVCAWTAYQNQSTSGITYEALVEEATENGKTLYALLQEFKKHHRCEFVVDGVSPEDALLNSPLVHRCHVEVTTDDLSILRIRSAARRGGDTD